MRRRARNPPSPLFPHTHRTRHPPLRLPPCHPATHTRHPHRLTPPSRRRSYHLGKSIAMTYLCIDPKSIEYFTDLYFFVTTA